MPRTAAPLMLPTIAVCLASPSLHADLVGWWKFDDAAPGDTTVTTALDSSGFGATGVFAGGGDGPDWVAGKSGSAFEFTGGSERIEVGLPDQLKITGAVTMSSWIQREGASNFGILGGRDQTGGPAQDAFSLKTLNSSNDFLRWSIVGPGIDEVVVDSPDTLSSYQADAPDGWVHVVGVYSPGQFSRMYVNGELVGEEIVEIPLSIQDTPTPFQFGHNASNSGSFPLLAAIDDFQVYNEALTEADVQFLFNNPGSAIPTPGAAALLGLAGALGLRRRR